MVLLAGCAASPSSPSVVIPPQPRLSVTAAPTARPASPYSTGVAAPSAARPILTSLSRNGDATCGLDASGQAWCWRASVFEREGGPLPNAKVLSVAMTHACTIDTTGKMSCWGTNQYGELGDGTIAQHRDAALPVKGLPSVVEIATAYMRTCARTASGDLYCWGDRTWGKMAAGTAIDNGRSGENKPLAGAPIRTKIAAMAMQQAHSCAVTVEGALECWGTNLSGQILPASKEQGFSRATRVPHVKDVAAVALAELRSCALDRRGAVTCWGGEHRAPRAIELPGPAVEISLGSGHSCARLVDGRVACWGQNDRGQLGDGTKVDRERPVLVQLASGETANQIVCTFEESCALVRGGKVLCWGHDRGHDRDQLVDALTPREPDVRE